MQIVENYRGLGGFTFHRGSTCAAGLVSLPQQSRVRTIPLEVLVAEQGCDMMQIVRGGFLTYHNKRMIGFDRAWHLEDGDDEEPFNEFAARQLFRLIDFVVKAGSHNYTAQEAEAQTQVAIQHERTVMEHIGSDPTDEVLSGIMTDPTILDEFLNWRRERDIENDRVRAEQFAKMSLEENAERRRYDAWHYAQRAQFDGWWDREKQERHAANRRADARHARHRKHIPSRLNPSRQQWERIDAEIMATRAQINRDLDRDYRAALIQHERATSNIWAARFREDEQDKHDAETDNFHKRRSEHAPSIERARRDSRSRSRSRSRSPSRSHSVH